MDCPNPVILNATLILFKAFIPNEKQNKNDLFWQNQVLLLK